MNAALDRFVRPRLRIGRRSRSAFHVCGLTGVAAAVALAMVLVVRRGESPLVMAAIVVAAMLTFLALVMGQKIVSGEEQIIYYHHEIGVMVVAALLLRLLRQPPLLYLDATLLGIGAFLTCGRIGCLMVGCCHGKPYRFGVSYRDEHAVHGFPSYYTGIRLFPVQAVESLWVLFTTASGTWMVWHGAAPGSALAWYVVMYDSGRFSFEFIRGDDDRPYYGGFSQAQWISAMLLVLLVAAEWRGLLPWHAWHAVVAAAMIAAMIVLAIIRRVSPSERADIFHPHHVREVANALDEIAAANDGEAIHVVGTSRGVLISGGRTHFSFSRRDVPLSREAAEALAALVARLRRIGEKTELVRGEHGVYHLLLGSGAP